MNVAVKKHLLLLLLLTLLPFLGSAAEANQFIGGAKRFGVFIGSNNGGRGRVMLRYAVTDAQAVSRVFLDMGGIAQADSRMLIEPSLREINACLDTLHDQVVQAKATHRRTEIVFYYSGHSDEDGLLLGRERYGYRELRDRINRIPSDMRIVILDSCSSGAFTRAKGGTKTQPFMLDSSVSAEGYAFLTSSSADEVSQESDSIQSSYFTHSLVAGLRGAADTIGDGLVTLNEVYRFAYTETLAKTETSLYGAQHPSYDMQISGIGDVVLTDIKEISASLWLDEAIAGRLSIRDTADRLVAEIAKTSAMPMELGLEPGQYRVTLQQGDVYFRADAELQRDQQYRLTRGQFRSISPLAATPRGGSGESMDDGDDLSQDIAVPVNTEPAPEGPWWSEDPDINRILQEARRIYGGTAPGMEEAQGASRDSPMGNPAAGASMSLPQTVLEPIRLHAVSGVSLLPSYPPGIPVTNNLMLGIVTAQGYRLRGIAAATIGLYSEDSVWGLSSAGVYAIAWGNYYGIQTGGVFALGGRSFVGLQSGGVFAMALGNLYGIQAGGVFTYTDGTALGVQLGGAANLVNWDFTGFQAAGLFNYVGDGFKGFQAAPVNISLGNTQGLQLGFFNLAGKGEETVQIGLINVSRTSATFPIGVLNLVKDGIFHPAVTFDDMEFINISFRSGSRVFYSIFLFGFQKLTTEQGTLAFRDQADDFLLTCRGGFGFELTPDRLFFDLDFLFGGIFGQRQSGEATSIFNGQARFSGGFKFGNHFAIYGGITYNYLYRLSDAPSNAQGNATGDLPETMAIHIFSESTTHHIHRIGFFAGVQF